MHIQINTVARTSKGLLDMVIDYEGGGGSVCDVGVMGVVFLTEMSPLWSLLSVWNSKRSAVAGAGDAFSLRGSEMKLRK